MPYRAPVADILFSLKHVAGFADALAGGLYGELDLDTAETIVTEAGKFAQEAIAPLDAIGDREGARYENGVVFMPRGFREAYQSWAASGWAGVSAAIEHGGMGLPRAVNAACTELWAGGSIGFALCPLLGEGAIDALAAHADPAMRETYLKRLISGEWTGTMNLTEPQAGSDLGAVKTRAEPAGDGTYRLTGQKIFITYGEHDMADNIVHLVLARLPDAPPGTRGISLFLAPKFLVKEDGSLGERNDLRCASIEHKLGIHASPTCVMIYGDGGGAKAWLVGEANHGLNAMFVMMNAARLGVGLQGVAIGEKAFQRALAFARERRQGRAQRGAEASAIVEHPDVRRMLLTMKALTQAARGICHLTAMAIDAAERAGNFETRDEASERAALLTPVAKAFSSDIGDEVASLGLQIHGGMGYIEETGAAQLVRDARIAAIYEGTNGIQAIDLVQRKLPLSNGAALAREIAMMRATIAEVAAANDSEFGATAARLVDAVNAFEQAGAFLARALNTDPTSALAGASAYLRLFGLALGGVCLARAGLAARELPEERGRIGLARFYAEKLTTVAPGLARAIVSGAAALRGCDAILAETV
ncbi:MAG: acyl-CoA dehydrogenase [Bradyrhizobium sp.]|nr:MAG: acyl-CoA dehydrogenase [Bradyrhizobium sp.]